MTVRTTLSLPGETLETLKSIAKKNNVKSLSQFVSGIIQNYIIEQKTLQKRKIKEENYKKYAQNFSAEKRKASQEMEEAALFDLLERDS